jgi:putative addiction module component (TIGR02574 family)
MIDTAIESAIAAMSIDERLELVEFIEGTVDQSTLEMPDEQKDMIRGRAREFVADPSIGLPWSELDARLGSRWQ